MLDNVGEKNYRVLLLKLKFLLILLGTIGGSAIASMSVFTSTITGLLIFNICYQIYEFDGESGNHKIFLKKYLCSAVTNIEMLVICTFSIPRH